jgi:hypothetical protein
MTTADWALVISLFSFALSLAGFVWNVWSKFIYPKPVLRVHFAMVTIMGDDSSDDFDLLCLTATNMGPVEITLKSALVMFARTLIKKKRHAILRALPGIPSSRLEYEIAAAAGGTSGGLPKKLAVGEEFSIYLIPDHESLAKGDYQAIGFYDSFGREHWAPRRDILGALPYIRQACEKAGKDWRAARQ